MLNTILASKDKMSQTFVGNSRMPVTIVKAGPCVVTQIKKLEPDGYWAVQLGFGSRRIKTVSKPMQGHFKKTSNLQLATNNLPRFIKEIRLDKEPEYKVGDQIKASDIFRQGDVIQVTGTSKGKGFAGVVKRWRFAGGPKTHGQSDRQRAPGSIGQGTTPGRVYKGKHMAGRMGSGTVTIKNLQVVSIDPEKDEIVISGAIPGAPGALLVINKLSSGKLEEKEVAVAQIVEGEEEKVEEVKEVEKVEQAEKVKEAQA